MSSSTRNASGSGRHSHPPRTPPARGAMRPITADAWLGHLHKVGNCPRSRCAPASSGHGASWRRGAMRVGPDYATAADEEVTSTASLSPDGRVQRHRSAEVASGPPARGVAHHQAQLYGRTAAAGTTQCRRPWHRPVTDQIEPSRVKDLGDVVDGFGGITRAESRSLDQVPPQSDQPSHAASRRRLSSAQSSRGMTSPRPTWRASMGQGSPSCSCS